MEEGSDISAIDRLVEQFAVPLQAAQSDTDAVKSVT